MALLKVDVTTSGASVVVASVVFESAVLEVVVAATAVEIT